MSSHPPVVVIYETRREAENVVRDLKKAGFHMMDLSVVGNVETALKAGKFLAIANGTLEEVNRASAIMNRRRVSRFPVDVK